MLHGRLTIKLAHLEAMALHHSPAMFLVNSGEAALVALQIVGNRERCLHVLFYLICSMEQSEAAESVGDAQES
jgi:hypothetical protein